MRTSVRVALVSLAAVLALPAATPQESASCLSSDPAVWPKPSKPYFLVIADTSGSMLAGVGSASSCGFGSTRLGHLRCALRNAVLAYSGQANLGLATFDMIQKSCTSTCSCAATDPHCFTSCQYSCYASELATRGNCAGCGPKPGTAATASGALVVVPVQQDAFWTNPPAASNVASLLSWVDSSCSSDKELFARGNTPLNGALRDAKRYFAGTYVAADGVTTYPSPLAAEDLAGAGVNGSTGCRSVNVILLIDGDESCDLQSDVVAAAQDLYQNGVTIGVKTYKIRVHVVSLAGGASLANADAIAAAGGTGSSMLANDEVQLSQALASIMAGAIKPETCNNLDDDCNGCTDEGFPHYANVGQTCCAWSTTPQRNACLATYTATITPADPEGDRTKLPCTTLTQQAEPASWLCFDPGDACDYADNDGNGQIDEGLVKCGSPLHCPMAEACNGQDDDCDGLVDGGGVCASCAVAPSSEVCDGCDNDCNGVVDDSGAPPIPCGLAPGSTVPAHCAGTMTCKPPVSVQPGTCSAVGGYTQCSWTQLPEVCDGMDNDCSGIVDDNVPSVDCVPPGTPVLDYGPNSQCKKGKTTCTGGVTNCNGFVGPSAEVCDGVDNDCDGAVDVGASGMGQPCGTSIPPCSVGVTACVNGAIVCQGGVQPQPELCDGVDNDCNGGIDDGALADGPAAGQTGCWELPGACCQFPAVNPTVFWCPPPGATCNGLGTLSGTCRQGELRCTSGSWSCSESREPGAPVCNGQDNDCDGVADDSVIPGVGEACGTDVGECTVGLVECTANGLHCSGIPPATEVCDGLDNDCNGVIDEGIGCGDGDACTRITCPEDATCALRGGGGVCVKTETITSSAGCGTTGRGGSGAATLGLVLLALLLGRRRPAARRRAPGAAILALPLVLAVGLAGCEKETTTTREVEVEPAVGAGCTPTNGGVEICDGLDNDCDGVVDDDLTSSSDPRIGSVCQGGDLGACADPVRAGTLACIGGRPICLGAAVLRPHQQAETCNGVDDDCDGIVDDDSVDSGIPCGTSNLAPCAMGITVCEGGALTCVGAIEPDVERCNGIDDDCSGTVDDNLPSSESGGACNVRPSPPGGATSACQAGTLACVGGAVECQGSTGPTSSVDGCGVDANCDGQLTLQPDLQSDVHHCGGCGNDCYAGAVHATWACISGACVFQSCQLGYHDNGGPGDTVAGDHECGYACTFASAQEACNGEDDNCDGQIDEAGSLTAPSLTQVCGVGPSATTPECQRYDATNDPGGVSVTCTGGQWTCTFHTAGVCEPTCAGATEVCETSGPALDNDCDGLVNENVANYGLPCASDDGMPPPGDGYCRATGTFVCATANTTRCSAMKDLSRVGPELCDGIDNDCDGLIDETFNGKGSNSTYFVKPAVTKVGASLWMYSYEASRPSATSTVPGTGNGYWTSAPVGATLDRTLACSAANKIPWFNVTPAEAEQTCSAMGGHVCTVAEWQTACQATTPCTWGYAPRGAACTSAYTSSKYCNLAPSFDFDTVTAGDQDGLLPTASASLGNCWADWSNLNGNTATTNRVFDVTGNLREITKSGTNAYQLMGGSFLTQSESGATCTFSSYQVDDAFEQRDTGFRCCFASDPSQ